MDFFPAVKGESVWKVRKTEKIEKIERKSDKGADGHKKLREI